MQLLEYVEVQRRARKLSVLQARRCHSIIVSVQYGCAGYLSLMPLRATLTTSKHED